jgi:hypothetical protein
MKLRFWRREEICHRTFRRRGITGDWVDHRKIHAVYNKFTNRLIYADLYDSLHDIPVSHTDKQDTVERWIEYGYKSDAMKMVFE